MIVKSEEKDERWITVNGLNGWHSDKHVLNTRTGRFRYDIINPEGRIVANLWSDGTMCIENPEGGFDTHDDFEGDIEKAMRFAFLKTQKPIVVSK